MRRTAVQFAELPENVSASAASFQYDGITAIPRGCINAADALTAASAVTLLLLLLPLMLLLPLLLINFGC